MYDGGPAGQFFYDLFAPYATLFDDWGYGNPGDPGAGIEVNGVDPIGVAGPWTVDATGQLVASGGAGFVPAMDPLQMLAGMEYAGVQTFVGPIDDLLADAGQSPLPTSFVDSLLSGYDALNQPGAALFPHGTPAAVIGRLAAVGLRRAESARRVAVDRVDRRDGEHSVAGTGRDIQRGAAA